MSKSRQIKHTQNKSNKSAKGQVRIIGGAMRGRKVEFIDGEGLRPTLDNVRETLFNWLAVDISGANCLDLFAGSGVLGFEALSRGANSATLVDSSQQVRTSIKSNAKKMELLNAKIVHSSAEKFLSNNTEKFDIVFLDPPFDQGLLDGILEKLKSHLNENALVYVEQENASSTLKFGKEWLILKSKKTGRFYFELIRLQ